MLIDKKLYLTKEGLERFKKEYKELKNFKLARTKGEFPKVLHSEDLDPEYLSLQEDLNFLNSRMIELENILKNVEIIKVPPKEKRVAINLGAKVLVEVDGQPNEFEILGTLEANPSIGKISNESPVGKTLLGRRVGEEIIISSPIKTIYKIKKIKYETT